MNAARDKLLRSLRAAQDDAGIVDTNVTLMVSWTGLSRASIYRALEQLTREGYIETEAKYGPGGGLRIGLKSVSNRSQNRSQKSQLHNALKTLVSGTTSPKPKPESPDETVSNQSHEEPATRWWVCCTWEDNKGHLWCHGDDGIPTYIPCASKEEAMELAEDHYRKPHRAFTTDPPSRCRSDVVTVSGRGKTLEYSFGTGYTADGRPGQPDNPWAL